MNQQPDLSEGICVGLVILSVASRLCFYDILELEIRGSCDGKLYGGLHFESLLTSHLVHSSFH